MFHYECKASKGKVIKTCIDGFLFGVCCAENDKGNTDDEKMDEKAKDPLEIVDDIVAAFNASQVLLIYVNDIKLRLYQCH